MNAYKLWNDGKVILLQLQADPQDGDVIFHGGIEYTVGGRRFVDGWLHYVVTEPVKSVWEDPNYSANKLGD
ncbi:MAG: hypothetical protein E5Y01_03180 [Mesorhizobium sp.]|uniref:hypothetical protein n=1 Tax=Mesorhizobium sp. TaxID=1871066 RepID=UPI001222A02D|nr:hypothetical protein [Mesorhizobium sp.]TJV53331.1 MAG: hypothetical protein E5Y01_03180 [Mesorhizobium sp.]